jgi:hypothetical protein
MIQKSIPSIIANGITKKGTTKTRTAMGKIKMAPRMALAIL